MNLNGIYSENMEIYCLHITLFILLVTAVYCDICSVKNKDGQIHSLYCMNECCGSLTKRYCCGSGRLSAGAIVGIAVGSILGLLLSIVLISLCVFYCCIRNRSNPGTTGENSSDLGENPFRVSDTEHLQHKSLPPIQYASARFTYQNGNDEIQNADHHSSQVKQLPLYDEIYQSKQ